jgi:hypothetical protein
VADAGLAVATGLVVMFRGNVGLPAVVPGDKFVDERGRLAGAKARRQ